jgi:monovalent cation/hydrogen antiporter
VTFADDDRGTRPCEHVEADVQLDAPLDICTACSAIDSTWVHLRQCLACGRTSCCNLSPNRHAAAHFRETGHPMIRSAQPDEDWQWCFADDRLYVADAPGTGGRNP